MNWIVITSPSFFEGEAFFIEALLDAGVDTVHLRKPSWSIDEYTSLIEEIPCNCRGNIVIHDYFSLCGEYGLKGIHLNSRNPSVPSGHGGSISISCHSLSQLNEAKEIYDYAFISPIFDSVSKQGYKSAFDAETLADASREGVISSQAVALGGVDLERIPFLKDLNFGGAAMLGCIWNRVNSVGFKSYLKAIDACIHG